MSEDPRPTAETLQWVEALPPARPGRNQSGVDWVAIAEELKANPGQWALVASKVNSGIAARLKALGCQVTTRKPADMTGYKPTQVDLYARWPEPIEPDA